VVGIVEKIGDETQGDFQDPKTTARGNKYIRKVSRGTFLSFLPYFTRFLTRTVPIAGINHENEALIQL